MTHTDNTSSQLTNAYQSILAELLQELVLTDAWRRLINNLRLHPNTEDSQAITAKLCRAYVETPFLRPPEGDALPMPVRTAAPAAGPLTCRPAHSDHACSSALPALSAPAIVRPADDELPLGHLWIGHSCGPGHGQSALPAPVSRGKALTSTVDAILAMVLASPEPGVVGHLCELLLTLEVSDPGMQARCVHQLTQRLFDFAGSLPDNELACVGLLRVLAAYEGPSLLRLLLRTAEPRTLAMASMVLRAWGFGIAVAAEHCQPLDDRWTDPDEVCQPLAILAAEVADVGTLCGLLESTVFVLDLVPRPRAHAVRVHMRSVPF